MAFSDNKHDEPGNLQHHVLLVVLVEACVTLLAKRPLIFNVFDDVLVLNTPIIVDIKFVFNVLFVIIDLNDAFDFEHTNQQVLEELNFDLLLDDDERSILQLDNDLVDLANRRHDGEHDHPPLGQQRLKVCMGVYVLNNLAPTRDVELECIVEIGQDTTNTNADGHVEKRAVMMRATIFDDQKRPDRRMQ
ncbi:unnamed protein product [Sphagnum balticum]